MLIIISGPSGSGKNTIIGELLKTHKNMRFFKSATTRPKREGEGDHHYFLNEQEFLRKKERGEFFESEEVHGLHYGILWNEINKIIADQENDYIRDVDVNGNANLRKYFSGRAEVLSIFIDAPDDCLYQRLIARGESEERARERLKRAAMERSHIGEFDIVLQNTDLKKAIEEIEGAIKTIRRRS